MFSNDDLNKISSTLPSYLSKPLREKLLSEIGDDFPSSKNPHKIYSFYDYQHFLQGDALIEVNFPHLESGKYEMRYYNALILSNTCDIEDSNKRLVKSNVIFCTIYSLEVYLKELKKNNIKLERINSFLNSLKSNEYSSLFYLPELVLNGVQIVEESFIRFDEVTSIPSENLKKFFSLEYREKKGDRIFSLSQYGFYLLLFKLSIHFSRMREGIERPFLTEN